MPYLFIITIVVTALISLFLFLNAIVSLIEDIMGKPLFVHFYTKLKALSSGNESILQQNFSYYQQLDSKKRAYFNHRVAGFLEQYQFVGREGFLVTEEVKVMISATSVMLTFGLREYLFEDFDKIIVYPKSYYSKITGKRHKGEFNPNLKAIVLSWKDFKEGFEDHTDNLNLGIHEFSHALHFHGLTKKDSSAALFSKHFQTIHEEIHRPANKQRLINSDYFRVYAYTNEFEFIAVIIEHYFETPNEFREEFPELFLDVSRMLNQQILRS